MYGFVDLYLLNHRGKKLYVTARLFVFPGFRFFFHLVFHFHAVSFHLFACLFLPTRMFYLSVSRKNPNKWRALATCACLVIIGPPAHTHLRCGALWRGSTQRKISLFRQNSPSNVTANKQKKQYHNLQNTTVGTDCVQAILGEMSFVL